jgi:cytochrome c-type biogenesis protein CcmH
MRLPSPFNYFPLAAATLLCLSVAACKDDPKSIDGSVKIAPELAAKVSANAVVYVIARPDGAVGGPPLAVKRLPQPFTFPIEFSISAQDAMMPNANFDGKISVSARLSQSGAAIPASPGDIEGTAKPNPAEPGKGKIEITLDKVRE